MVYGINNNSPAYLPPMARMPLARAAGPMMVFGGNNHCHCGPSTTGMLISGGVGFGLGALFGALFGRKNKAAQQPMYYQPQPYMPQGGYPQGGIQDPNGLKNLEKLYGAKGFDIVQNGDGTYAAAKNGQNIVTSATYEQMQEILGNYNAGKDTKVDNNGGKVDDNGDKVDDNGGKVDDNGGKVDGNGGKVDDNGGKVDGNGGKVDGDDKPVDSNSKPVVGDSKPVIDDSKPVDGDGDKVDDNGGKADETKGKASHTVVAGDNLWNIAKQHLKDKGNANPTNAEILAETRRLMDVNGYKLDDKQRVMLRPGDVVKYGDDTEDKKAATTRTAVAQKPVKAPATNTASTAKKAVTTTDKNDAKSAAKAEAKTEQKTQQQMPADIAEWNKSHKNQQIYKKGNSYATTVHTSKGTKEITGKDFKELKANVDKYIASNKSTSTVKSTSIGGYAGLGGMLRSSMSPKS